MRRGCRALARLFFAVAWVAAGPAAVAAAALPAANFSKISNEGRTLPVEAALGPHAGDWGCTRDDRSGLVWEVKVDDAAHLRHMARRYIWSEGAAPQDAGSPGAVGRCAGGEPCESTRLVSAVNVAGMCGAHDWRLPTVKELESIVDFGRSGPAIDLRFFPHTPDSYFWSATPSAGDAGTAWYVSFNHGSASQGFRDFGLHVRLVRGGKAGDRWVEAGAGAAANCGMAEPAFVDHGDGSITDRGTGLRWRRCAEGQRWSDGRCSGAATLHGWSEAMALGRDGWRLPQVVELRSIVDEGCRAPAIDGRVFPDAPGQRFWSATPFPTYPGQAWSVDFASGGAAYEDKAHARAVRLVRGVQPDSRLGAGPR
jgi:Protein of unknown function (DUF1566)